MPTVRLLIVNYNGSEFLARCFSAVAAQSFHDFEVVIADNASIDGSDATPLPDARFRWLKLPENMGFAEGNNRAAEGAQSEFIATLNPDAFPEPQWLERLVATAKQYPQACMFGSTQIYDLNPQLLDGTGDQYFAIGLMWRANFRKPIDRLPPLGECFCPCAAAALYRSDWFFRAGGFDSRFFCYCEDVDLGFRLRLLGGRCIQAPDAVVRHVGSGITGNDLPFVRYHYARNRMWIFLKNMPGWLFAALLLPHIALTLAMLVRALFRLELFATGRGVIDGLRGLPAILAARRQLQQRRSVSTLAIARALSWSPLKMLRRAPDMREP